MPISSHVSPIPPSPPGEPHDEWEDDALAANRLVALVGHELRAPLASALMYLGIADQRAADAAGAGATSVRAALAIARGEIRRLDQVVLRVLEMERFGRATMHPERCDLGGLVRGAIERSLAVGQAAQIRMEIPATEGLVDWWDATAVEQIVQNLVSNALRFGGSHPVQVTLDCETPGARIVVRDHGVGINPADREKIFRRNVRSASGGGLGLGLWMVRELAQAHGGAVEVSSRPGDGSAFTVTLRSLADATARRDPPPAPPTHADVPDLQVGNA